MNNYKYVSLCIILLSTSLLLSACFGDANFLSISHADEVCPEFLAKVGSTWDSPLYFVLSSKGQIAVYKPHNDCSLDDFMAGVGERKLVCEKQLSIDELHEINEAFNNIGIWQEETMVAYDLLEVESYYLDTYQHFYMASGKNPGYVKIVKLLIEYSIGGFDNL